MKIGLKVTERDKKILGVFTLFIIAIGLIFFILRPLYSKLVYESDKNKELNVKLSELTKTKNNIEKNKEKYEQQRLEYMSISREIPTNLSEKYVISDVYNISSQVSADVGSYIFSSKLDGKNILSSSNKETSQSNNENQKDNNKVNKGTYSYMATTDWKVDYNNLKKLLTLSKTYKSLFSIGNISISPIEDKLLNVSFDINFIGYEDEKAPLKVWDGYDLTTGKGEIFAAITSPSLGLVNGDQIDGSTSSNSETQASAGASSTSSGASSVLGDSSLATLDKNKDFVTVLSTVNSPMSSVVMEKVGEKKSIFGANKSFENTSIELKGKSGNYKYNMITENEKHPLTGHKDFKPNGENIVIIVYSSARKGVEDKNIVNIKITNDSDKKVYVYIVGDDEKLPRCNITKGGKNVYVEKR